MIRPLQALAFLALLIAASTAMAQQDQAVFTGLRFLSARAGGQQVGESAMIALALIKAETPIGDPALAGCLAKIRSRFTTSGYSPQRMGGQDVYEAAAVALVLCNLESAERGGEVGTIASYLIGRQNANGSWDYTGRPHGDSSITQYALLGLWECENAGAKVSPAVWDRAAAWYMSVQSSAGSWNYHRDEGPRYGETVSMTAAGVGSLLICQRQLDRFRKGKKGVSSLLTNLTATGTDENYQATTSSAAIDQSVKKGMAWLGSNFNPAGQGIMGQSAYYGLYGIERIGALSDRQMLGRVDWFEKGKSFIHSTQRGDGSWNYPPNSDEMNTVWAVLFLTKSTAKTLKRVENRRLAGGTLLGGRGLPTDLTAMTVAGGRIMARPMNGAIEGMLAVLEDPRAQNAENAVAGLVERYRQQGRQALLPFKDRFHKMLSDRDPGVREVAAWGLSRIGDLDAVPDLVTAILDPEERVVSSARMGLQLLSRKIDGLGPPSPSTPEQRQEAARKWRDWYDSIRPLEATGQDIDTSAKVAPAKPPAGNLPGRLSR